MEKERKLSRREFLKFCGISLTAGLVENIDRSLVERNFWPPEVVTRIETDSPQYALTIDDGWRSESLETMLDILKAKGVCADFFLVGTAALNCEARFPGILRRLASEGHGLAYHTMHHRLEDVLSQNEAWFSRDFDEWITLLRNIMGSELFTQSFFRGARAPGGAFTDEFIRFCNNKILTPYGWSNDPSTFNRGRLIRKGDILLLHVRASDEEYLRRLDSLTEGELEPTRITCLLGNDSCPKKEEQDLDLDDTVSLRRLIRKGLWGP